MNPIKKYLWMILSLTVGLGIFIYLIYYIGLDSLLNLFNNMHPLYFIPYAAVSILLFFGFVWRWKLIIDTYGFKTKFSNLFFYKTATFAINFITPGARLAGEPIRAAFLNQDGLDMPKAAGTVIMDKIVEMAADVILTMIGVLIFILHFALQKKAGLVILIDLAIFLLIIIWFFVRIHKGKGVFSTLIIKLRLTKFNYIAQRLNKTKEAEKQMHKFMIENKATFWWISFLSIALWLLSIFEFKLLALMFGYDLSYTVLFAVLVGVGFAILVPIPLALGALEGIQVILFKVIGQSPDLGIALGMITRLRDMMWASVGMIYMSRKGVKIEDEIKTKQEKIV